jgi:hypothetical protein
MQRISEVLEKDKNLCRSEQEQKQEQGGSASVDFAGGSNVMAWHAAVRYCDFAMGFDINTNRCRLAAYYALQILVDDPD